MRMRPGIAAAAVAILALVCVAAAAAFPDEQPAEAAPARPGPERAAQLTAERMRRGGIADVPVEFAVENTNRSEAACNTDGAGYRIRGHITAPAQALAGGTATLYLHGLSSGEWYWRMNAPGYHHAEEMARRGHVSVTVDRLGYGDSGKPPGLQTCLGGQADIAHQITEQLKDGDYTATGPAAGAEPAGSGEDALTPEFDRVVLAGHGNGAEIAQIAAYSFGGADALVVLGWSGRGLTDRHNARFFGALAACMQGGVPAGGDSGPGGYAFFDTGPDEFADANLHDAEPAVVEAAVRLQSRHPCGDLANRLESVANGTRNYSEIEVPVFFAYGAQDEQVQGGGSHRALFGGTDDTELLMLDGSGHYMGLERGADRLHRRMAAWLDRESLV
ncbi:alpha/beta hydrolase [Streptomonospora wellingtoniae]|uniref:Alpha/beta hydrolase n=1 Tax=Streptomonospora wellingtoniae TaxID=3075544 RepID=A0ABU2KSY1_9ACTN|nr:alpha/beta hydrolase [Streptomonospora sp. DSM 45055]MDT0302395.1 alpha/beta hydrolase [Streptomonospora sp. DSM 45055]